MRQLIQPRLSSAIDSTGEGGTILRASTLETHLSESRALDRLTTTLVGRCGLIALAMATIGVYGIMTDAVQRRTREIGLRVALGARRAHVARLVFTEAVYLALAGLLTGSVVAVGITHMARFAIGTTASLDIVTLAVASGALAAVIAVAAILPLRRALRVSPNIALRAE
jgi:ABC-type antimicrobial peptide transport system permease subunit